MLDKPQSKQRYSRAKQQPNEPDSGPSRRPRAAPLLALLALPACALFGVGDTGLVRVHDEDGDPIPGVEVHYSSPPFGGRAEPTDLRGRTRIDGLLIDMNRMDVRIIRNGNTEASRFVRDWPLDITLPKYWRGEPYSFPRMGTPGHPPFVRPMASLGYDVRGGPAGTSQTRHRTPSLERCASGPTLRSHARATGPILACNDVLGGPRAPRQHPLVGSPVVRRNRTHVRLLLRTRVAGIRRRLTLVCLV